MDLLAVVLGDKPEALSVFWTGSIERFWASQRVTYIVASSWRYSGNRSDNAMENGLNDRNDGVERRSGQRV